MTEGALFLLDLWPPIRSSNNKKEGSNRVYICVCQPTPPGRKEDLRWDFVRPRAAARLRASWWQQRARAASVRGGSQKRTELLDAWCCYGRGLCHETASRFPKPPAKGCNLRRQRAGRLEDELRDHEGAVCRINLISVALRAREGAPEKGTCVIETDGSGKSCWAHTSGRTPPVDFASPDRWEVFSGIGCSAVRPDRGRFFKRSYALRCSQVGRGARRQQWWPARAPSEMSALIGRALT